MNASPALTLDKRPKASHAAVLTLAQLSRAISRLLWLVLVARELGPSQFGIYTLLFTMNEIVALVSGVGYGDYLTRESAQRESLGWFLGIRLTWLRLGYIVPLTLFELAAISLLRYPHTVFLGAAYLALTLPTRCLTESIEGVLRGIQGYMRYLILELVLGLSLVGSGLALWVRHAGLGFAIGGEIASSTCAGLAALWFVLQPRTRDAKLPGWWNLIKQSAIFNVYPVVNNLFDRIDVLLLAKMAGSYATGIYSAAYRPLGAAQLLPYGVLYSIFPSLSRNSGKGEEQRLERAMGLLFSFALVAVLVTMVFGGPIVKFVLGPRYTESTAALEILIWAIVFRYLNYSLNMRLLAASMERVFILTSLVCLAANVIGNLILIPLFSWRAAAGVTLGTELLLLGQNVYWVRRTVGIIPKPVGWLKTGGVFAALLVAASAGSRIVSPMVAGSASLALFLAYLVGTGLIGQFADTWAVGRPEGWEPSKS